jgi:hypothetical protein
MKENKKSNGKTSTQSQKEEDKKFPGYPHYPKDEDVMNGAEEVYETSFDTEKEEEVSPAFRPKTDLDEDPEMEIVDGTEADVTEEDLDELERDGLQDRNFHPDEIDVPGAELDDAQEEIGEEDEENNYYSLGGDDKENLEENPDR